MAELSTRGRPESTRRLALRIAQLCSAIRDILNARRVSVLLYDPAADAVSLLVSDQPEDERLSDLGGKWARIALDEFPAARAALIEQSAVVIEDAQRDQRLPPGLAADFGTTSVHLEPLLSGGPVGILAIEPAPAAQSGDLRSIVPLVATSAARVPRREEIELEQTQADFLVELLDAAAAEPSLDGVLGTVCERVARRLGARRAAIFLRENGHLVPRMARDPDGAHDHEACERFRQAASTPPLIETVVESADPAVAEEPDSPLIAGWCSEALGIGSALAVPIGKPPHIIGVLTVDTSAPRRFPEDEIRLVTDVGARIAGIVERTRELEERTAHLRAATAVRRLLEEGSRAVSAGEAGETLARVAKEALGVPHASVFLADSEDRIEYVGLDVPERFEAIARERLVGSPAREFRLWRRATRQPKPIFVEDASASELIPSELVTLLGLRSYVAFPLLSSDRALGLVVCSETREGRRWSPEQQRLVTQLALEGSLVVENAALRGTDQERIDELSRQAFHDPLTELPNRALFADRLEHALARLHRRHESLAVMLLDLDGFKAINDNFGHEAGDQLLIAVGQRLRACLRPADTVARLGGDEFTILLEEISHLREATRVAERIEHSLRTPFVLDGHEATITTSIGIALNSAEEAEPQQLLRNADTAMYRAKHAGKARYEVYELQGNPSPLERLDASEADFEIKRSTFRDAAEEREEGDGRSSLAEHTDD
jgi:diguanylate cyclase (GGDEF)-like protein